VFTITFKLRKKCAWFEEATNILRENKWLFQANLSKVQSKSIDLTTEKL